MARVPWRFVGGGRWWGRRGGVIKTVHRLQLHLARSIAGVVTRVHPSLYTLFNTLPTLQSHVLCRIEND